MGMRIVYWASLLAVVLGGAATASAAPANRCGLGGYNATAVSPFKMEEDFGLGGYTVLKGAKFYVAAKPGLTAEWLTLIVHNEFERLQQDADQTCRPPNLRGVQVQVAPAGAGFWVYLMAPDVKSASKLLNWAKSIQTPPAVQ
jgi:hypothetical protein